MARLTSSTENIIETEMKVKDSRHRCTVLIFGQTRLGIRLGSQESKHGVQGLRTRYN